MDRKNRQAGPIALRILSLSTLHPSAAAPNFGRFVQLSLDAADATGAADIVRICPNGLPPWPLAQVHPRYRAFAALPEQDGAIYRPRFTLLPGFNPARNSGAIAKAVLPLALRLHAEQPFDLVDAQFFWPDGPAAMHIAAALNVPFSIKARGADIHHWTTIKSCREQIVEAAQKAAGLLAVSQAIKTDIAALGVDPAKIFVHRTGIDRTSFEVPSEPLADLRQRLDLPTDGPLLVCTGALIPRKGQVFAIEALALLPAVRLAIIGAGEDEAKLRTRTAELGLTDRVHFTGSLPHCDIARHVKAADISVLPSSSEGIANAWIEALACGTPLVITDAGGAREVLVDPSAGRIVERKASAIAAAVLDILANPPSRGAVAASVADYSWQRNGEALVKYWQTLVSRSS
jgi:teichuronic acid biosynthesis glycosyltransferase TuaC